MNQQQKKNKRRELRARAKVRAAEKLADIEEQEEDLDVLETANETEVKEADYYTPDGVPVAAEQDDYQPAPISFAELDEMESAQEEAHAVMEVTYNTEYLVRNILHDPDMDASEKAEAISTVADDFASRVTDEVSVENKDLELLQLESIVAQDHRSMTALDYIEDMAKRVLSTASRNSLSDSDFALVTTRNGKKVKKYPIHDKAHIRNALARAAQMIKRGGQAASDARAALPKIHAAAKKMGIGSSTSKERNSIVIEKDAKNDWRWVGWVSNNFLDLDGDIISEDAHKEYVDWLDKNKDVAPAFLSWHTLGTARKNPVDFSMYENGFLIMSGKLEPNEAEGLLKAQTKTNIGMSHGTFVLSRDQNDPRVITKYRMYEASDLPLQKAANPFTNFETIFKEVDMDKVEYLAQILGSEEKAKAFVDKAGLKKKELTEANIESKEVTTTETKTESVVAPPAQEKPKEDINPVVSEVMKQMDVAGLNEFVTQAKVAIEKVPILEELVKSLQQKQDDKLAEILTPPVAKFAWTSEKRASQSDENKVSDEETKHAAPGVPEGYWLSDVTKTTPIKVD